MKGQMKFVILDDSDKSTAWLLMVWRPKEPGHQQPWYWHHLILSPVKFPSRGPVILIFNASFVICKQAIEHIIELPLIWNTLMRAWRHCNDVISFLVPSTLSGNAGVALRWPLGLWSWQVVSSPWLLENRTGCNSITLIQNLTKTSIMFLVCRPS